VETATTSVTIKNTAKAVKSGNLDVFSTPMMIALMEEAACKAIIPLLEEGQTSVGVAIAVEHTAASPIGAKITATAHITATDKRKVIFELAAHDDANPIGKGTHTRYIVDTEAFMNRLYSPDKS